MKYVYYGLAVFVILQALVMAALFPHMVEDTAVSILLAFLYGVASGPIAGILLILGWEEK